VTTVQRAPGALVEPIGEQWVAFSPLSGETHFLNNSSAAVLECLPPQQPRADAEVYTMLSEDSQLSPAEVENVLAPCWAQLVEAGLIVRV
jgi:PqqD family protein of HPr-rel-A system